MEEYVQEQENQDIEVNISAMSDRKIGETFEKTEKPNLDGKEVEITNVILKLKPEVKTTKDGKKETRSFIFSLEYDGLHRENFGGVTAFVHDGKVGDPTIWIEGKSAATKLLKLWLDYTGKNFEDISYREFFLGLKGMKARIKNVTTMYQGDEFPKNIVTEFVGGAKAQPTSHHGIEMETVK
jgi:hypothetical protein